MITALTLAPIAAAVLIMALPEARARMVALGGALVSLALTVCMLTRFDLAEKGIQFKEKFSYTNPSLDEMRGRLTRNIESNLQVYITLRQQYELAKIEEARDHLLVTILDEAEASVLKKKPQRKIIVIGGIITGVLLSTIWAFFSSVISLTKKNKHVF